MSRRKITRIIYAYVIAVLVCSTISFIKLYSGWGDFDIISSLLSFIFVWQSLFIILFGITGVIVGIVTTNGKLYIVSVLSIIIPCVLFIGASEAQVTGRYMTGLTPSGPDFNCLTWKTPVKINDEIYSAENVNCALFHMPDYNKFWFDQSESASSTNSVSYYLTLFVSQALLYMPLIIWQRKNITQFIHRPT